MAFDLFTPAELITAAEENHKFTQLFLALFFPNKMEFASKQVMLDEIPGKVGMAVYCSPSVSGKVSKTRGSLTKSFEPGYAKPKHTVDIQATLRRRAGEPIGAPLTPSERYDFLVAQNIEDEEKALQQLEEHQAVQACLYGAYTMSGENLPEPVHVDMERKPENHIVQSGDGRWSVQSAADYDPTMDIDAYADLSSGTIDVLLMGGKAWAALNRFKAFREKFDTKRGSQSLAELGLKDLGAWVSIKGYYGDTMIMVTKNQYVDPTTGKETLYMPENGMLLGNRTADGYRLYGCIQDMDAVNDGMEVGSRYPKNWKEGGDPSNYYTMTQSAPAMVLPDANQFVFVEIN